MLEHARRSQNLHQKSLKLGTLTTFILYFKKNITWNQILKPPKFETNVAKFLISDGRGLSLIT